MRIVVLQPGAELYGSDRMMLVAVNALVEQGHSVTVVIAGDGPLCDLLREADCQVIIRRMLVLRKNLLNAREILRLPASLISSAYRLAKIIRRVKPDVLYANTITQTWAIPVCRLLGVPTVTHVREAELGVFKPIYFLVQTPLYLSAAVICNSRATLETLPPGLRARRTTTVVYNGKDWQPYRQATAAELAGPGDALRLVLVGRISPRKGQDIAVRALAGLVKFDPTQNYTLHMVGDVFPGYEGYRQELTHLAEQLDVADYCFYYGFSEAVATFYRAATVVVIPSRVEPFGTVMLEALAAGRPVVASSVQGLREIAEVTGAVTLVAVDSPGQLADACALVAADPPLAEARVRGASAALCGPFSEEAYKSRVVDVLVEAAIRKADR